MKYIPRKKVGKFLRIIFGILLVVVLLVGFSYFNLKSFTVKKIRMEDNQQVFLMGTFHSNHFRKCYNFSVEELLNVIDNVNPDVVFLEAREEYFNQYGLIDGPIDMVMSYCYCTEKSIPVELVDYWVIDDNFKENTTNDERDDQIHLNIMNKLEKHKGEKVLVICGFGHLNEQVQRLTKAGGRKEKIPQKSLLFQSEKTTFQYPTGMLEWWRKRAYFYCHTVPQLVQADDSIGDEMKAQWKEDVDGSMYNWQMRYQPLFEMNKLYL